MDSRRRIEELLKPGGEVLGTKPRRTGRVRRVAAGVEEARSIFEELEKLGHPAPVAGNPGQRVEIPGLGYVNYREESKSGPPSLDVSVTIEGLERVRFKFVGFIGTESASSPKNSQEEGGENG